MDRLRGILNRLWLWRAPHERGETLSTSSSSNVASRDDLLRYHESYRPVNALGPLYLDHFDRIYECTETLLGSEARLEGIERDRRYFQQVADMNQCDVLRLRSDSRADTTEFVADAEAARANAERDQNILRLHIGGALPAKQRLADRVEALWSQVYTHGQAYLDRCLDVSFSEPWSLSHTESIALRPLLDLHSILIRRKSELRQLEYDAIAARGTAEGISQDSKDRANDLKDKIGMTHKSLEESQPNFTSTHVRQLLFRAGVLEQQRSEEESESDALPETQSSPDSHHDLDYETEDTALARYLRAREIHETLQAKVSQSQRDLIATETQHLLAFPKSSITRFRLLVERLTADDVAAMQDAETAWIEAYENLLDLGIPVPQTPERGLEQIPTGGGLDQDKEEVVMISDSGQRRKRRRLNRVRAGIVQDADPGRSPSLPRSRDLGGLGSESPGWERRTASLSPNTRSGRKRKLRDYEAEMEDEWETV